MAEKDSKRSRRGHMLVLFFLLAILIKLVLLVIIIVRADGDNGTGNTVPEVSHGLGQDEDYYTSLIGVQNLVRKEQEILRRLKAYKEKLQDRIDLVSFYLDDYSDDIRALIHSSNNFKSKLKETKHPVFISEEELDWLSRHVSSNPLAVFKLFRRFKQELTDIVVDLRTENVDEGINDFVDKLVNTFKLPNDADLSGAAQGLLRLQEAYQLPTTELAKGNLMDKKTRTRFLASDLQFIGIEAYTAEQYATSVQWLFESYQKVVQGDDSVPMDMVRNTLRAASERHNKELLSFSPIPYRNLLTNVVNSNLSNIPDLHLIAAVPDAQYTSNSIVSQMSDVLNFQALCRGETLLSPQVAKSLRCWYSKEHSAFNILSPLQFELLHENPPVFQVYNLISERVIKHIKGIAFPHLRRAKIVGNVKEGSHSDTRTSSVAWLFDHITSTDNIIRKVPQMAHSAIGLECQKFSAAEELQISCYGSVGGYYIPHFDSLHDPMLPDEVSFMKTEDYKNRGDRVATVMFYLTDVELGGGTAFPRLGIAAKPFKGSAVMWYNLKRNGERDNLSLHGGCPVLYGNKWVANKWIRLNQQIHARKCSKDENE